MKFQVPQFIEIEDKIFGPLTIKQFVYIAGGAGFSFIIFRFIPWIFLSIPLILIAFGFSLAMAFYQINNRPLLEILQSAFGYYFANKLYLWKKTEKAPEKTKVVPTALLNQKPVYVSKLSESKLHDLSWRLDVGENLNSKENKE